MGWIFGIYGNIPASVEKNIPVFPSNKSFSLKRTNFYLLCGGFPDTTFYFEDKANHSGFAVSGVGISNESEKAMLLNETKWKNKLSGKISAIRELNGHFAGVKWDKNKLILFNDCFGLRELYYTTVSGCTIFSTRMDWLVKIRNDCQIDFRQFGAAWLDFNQLSDLCVITNITRLGPGTTLTLDSAGVNIDSRRWLPGVQEEISERTIIEILGKFLLLPLNVNRKISLGLSGGLDSRVLLAILATVAHRNFSLHTFGDPGHPDALIAGKIADQLDIEHMTINSEYESPENCLRYLREQLGQNLPHLPASEILRLRWYTPLHLQNKFVIDGGFGEIARRQYFNRLLLKGKNAIVEKNRNIIAACISHDRADIFNQEMIEEMEAGNLKQIGYILERMPDIDKTGIENWLDLLAVQTRLPNWYGFAQACVDGLSINYMPFAQKEFLNHIFNIPLSQRKNGRLFKKIIKTLKPELTGFPLVKGSVMHPYRSSTLAALTRTVVKKKLGLFYQDAEVQHMIEHLAEYIQDTVRSQEVKAYPYYNYSAIKKMVEHYFSGQKKYAKEIDWWLAFDVWRRML